MSGFDGIAQGANRVAPHMPGRPVVFREGPLTCRNIQNEVPAGSEVIEQGSKETRFVCYVLENIEQKNDVEPFSERRVLLENIIAIDRALSAYVHFQSSLIEVEPRDFFSVRIFDLTL